MSRGGQSQAAHRCPRGQTAQLLALASPAPGTAHGDFATDPDAIVTPMPPQTVRSSISIDETGGVYVVGESPDTSAGNYMWRVQWTGATLNTSEDDGAWRTSYPGEPHIATP